MRARLLVMAEKDRVWAKQSERGWGRAGAGSGLVAVACCWTSQGFHKTHQRIDLHDTGATGQRDGCYIRAAFAVESPSSHAIYVRAAIAEQCRGDAPCNSLERKARGTLLFSELVNRLWSGSMRRLSSRS